jgi:ABC-2 type transport system ATP-binding protein
MLLMIKIEGLHKRFGATTALRGVDLAVPRGTVCGLLGPNGAGKTTVVRVLATLLRPDSGRATIDGYDVSRHPGHVRPRIGLAGQYAVVDELLTGRANLVMFGRLYHLSRRAARRRADELLERFGLADWAGRRAGTYSGGLRRRLDLAASLLVAPPVLLMDEPTTGLDPRSRIAVWELISGLVDDGTTVMLTTQYLDEADRLAGQIVVLDTGRVVAAGSPGQLKASIGGERVDVVVRDGHRLADAALAVRAAVGTSPQVDTEQRRLTVADLSLRLLGFSSMVLCGVLLAGWRPHRGVLDTVAAFGLLALFGLAMIWVGTFIGLCVHSPSMADTATFSWLFPLTFLANTFVPTQGLPAWLRPVADWNPMSATVAAIRHLFGNPSPVAADVAWPLAHPVPVSIAWSVLLVAVFLPLAVRRYRMV